MTIPMTTKKCLVCQNKTGKIRNDTIYWHIDPDDGMIWCYCNRCERGYSVYDYCTEANINLGQFLKLDFDFREAPPNEVRKMEWPKTFIPLYDKRAAKGVEYIKSRGIEPDGEMYYDLNRNGIVFPYFYDNVFCGAQVRFLETWVDDDGVERKIDTVPGTRLGLLFYNWNQQVFRTNIKGVIVTEGAFNAVAIQQALSSVYPNMLENPWRCVACSGSGASKHHTDTIKELKDGGVKIVLAPDSDKAGMKMLRKFVEADAITHYALTNESDIDWNDALKAMGKRDFAKWFLGGIKGVDGKTKSYGDDRSPKKE